MSSTITSAASLLALASSCSTSTVSSGISVVERTILCSDGMRLAAQHWKLNRPSTSTSTSTSSISSSSLTPPSNKRILCLHGWLDNSSSFYLMAPSLLAKGCASEIIALDFPGHGKSDHKGMDAPPQLLSEYAHYVAEVTDHFDSDYYDDHNHNEQTQNAKQTLEESPKWTMVGHSMGAGVSVVFAAAWPEKMEQLVLLEAMGPLARNARDAAKHVRIASDKRRTSNKVLYPQFSSQSKSTSSPKSSKPSSTRGRGVRTYPTIEKAIETRIQTARLSPGAQYISKEAATAMVQRSTQSASAPNLNTGKEVVFAHDPRLNWPSLQYNTHEQVEAFLQDIACPTCVVLAEDGWPISSSMKERAVQLLQPTQYETFPGSHHHHADPNHAGPVIDFVAEFLLN